MGSENYRRACAGAQAGHRLRKVLAAVASKMSRPVRRLSSRSVLEPGRPSSSRRRAARRLARSAGVAFLGLGRHGDAHGPARRRELPLTVWNRTRARAEALSDVARARGDIAAGRRARGERRRDLRGRRRGAARRCSAATDGLLAGIDPDAVLVDMSTIGRAAAREAARAVEARGARFVDAPVSGSVGPAERGELLALVGGADADVERVTPVLGRCAAASCARAAWGRGRRSRSCSTAWGRTTSSPSRACWRWASGPVSRARRSSRRSRRARSRRRAT